MEVYVIEVGQKQQCFFTQMHPITTLQQTLAARGLEEHV